MATEGIEIKMTPSHPGDFIRTEIIEELGLNVTKAAKVLGVRRATLSDLLNGHASLSPEMALRVEKAFGVSMDMLLRMQAWYDASQMRARASEIKVRRYQHASAQEPARFLRLTARSTQSLDRPRQLRKQVGSDHAGRA